MAGGCSRGRGGCFFFGAMRKNGDLKVKEETSETKNSKQKGEGRNFLPTFGKKGGQAITGIHVSREMTFGSTVYGKRGNGRKRDHNIIPFW